MFWREKYIPFTVTQTYSDRIIDSTHQWSECDSVLLYFSGAHSAASCLCVLSSPAVFCIDPRVVVVQQLMQQGAGAGGSDVYVGQILNIVLSELRALHGRQMLKQLSHVATLVLLQQHQYHLQQQHISICHQNLICWGQRVPDDLQ